MITPEQLELTDGDLHEMARTALHFKIDLTGERVDRVFVNRATEYVIAKRLLQGMKPTGLLKQLLTSVSKLDWVSSPYGLSGNQRRSGDGDEKAHVDERGAACTTRYGIFAEPTEDKVVMLAEELADRRRRAIRQGQVPILDVYTKGPSLWFGANPSDCYARCARSASLVNSQISTSDSRSSSRTHVKRQRVRLEVSPSGVPGTSTRGPSRVRPA